MSFFFLFLVFDVFANHFFVKTYGTHSAPFLNRILVFFKVQEAVNISAVTPSAFKYCSWTGFKDKKDKDKTLLFLKRSI
jgi:hypothetical protein